MKVAAFHSSNPTDPDVHHNQNDCVSGRQIPSWNIVQGTGGYPLCGHCAKR
ncbi:hypothetical protein [Galactobacter valiniphilus]|uniref:hypothetical protein n=1 Tax=Galactobacter valiniphilus TaxID=2676122 RepID=UPI0013143502|nr:hypothetical protein [Galactobacter valiniphilus]